MFLRLRVNDDIGLNILEARILSGENKIVSSVGSILPNICVYAFFYENKWHISSYNSDYHKELEKLQNFFCNFLRNK